MIGCRITELASVHLGALKNGQLIFIAQTNKGRKERAVILPEAVFEKLRSLAGQEYVFEPFSEQLREIYVDRGCQCHAERITVYKPQTFKDWLERKTQKYFKKHPQRTKFKPHNFREAVMTRAWMAGVKIEDAAIAIACDSETMRQHDLALDEQAIADGFMGRINGAPESVAAQLASGEKVAAPTTNPTQ